MPVHKGFHVGFKVAKKMFFDSRQVLSAKERAEVGVHTRFGARVRKWSRWSLRYSKGPSTAPEPPHSHTGLLRKFIYYWVERHGGSGPFVNSVVIGPTLLASKKSRREAAIPTWKTVPEILEYGGIAHRYVTWSWLRGLYAAGKTSSAARAQFERYHSMLRPKGQPAAHVSVRYPPRPYMQPVFEDQLRHLPMLWRDAISEAGRNVGGVRAFRTRPRAA